MCSTCSQADRKELKIQNPLGVFTQSVKQHLYSGILIMPALILLQPMIIMIKEYTLSSQIKAFGVL